MTKRSWTLWAVVALLTTLSGASAQAVNSEWRIIGQDRGITVSTREEPGRDLPSFRGQAKIHAAVLHALAVVLDAKLAKKWVRGADQVEVIRDIDARTQLVYMYTDLPWPLRDRDTVMKRVVEVVKPGEEFRIRYVCAPKAKRVKDDVIRVQQCDSHFLLRKVDAETTYVDYQVNIDPGGALPDWGIRFLEKRVPIDTINRLERQIKRTLGKYTDVIQGWASAAPTTL